MLDDVSRLTTRSKVNDLLARLESRNTRTAIGGGGVLKNHCNDYGWPHADGTDLHNKDARQTSAASAVLRIA